MDDQPTWLRTRGGPLLSVPYPHEVNDVPMIVLHHGTAPAFAEMMTDNLDEMVEQSEQQPLVCGIIIHTFIMGQPYRLRRFRQGGRAPGWSARGLADDTGRDRRALRRDRPRQTALLRAASRTA